MGSDQEDSDMIKLGVSGACGKMGQRILSFASEDPDFEIRLALERQGHSEIGAPCFGTILGSSVDQIDLVDVLVDFSSIEGALKNVQACVKFGTALVLGTTGFSDDQRLLIEQASRKIPVVFSPNMSIGVNLLFSLVSQAASKLGQEYRVSITEAHHVHKKDAPSGTAKFLAGLIGSRATDIRSIREGEIVGDHEVVFESEWDTFKLSHSAKTRDIFAKGALIGAKFAAAKTPGLYSMQDVLKERKEDGNTVI